MMDISHFENLHGRARLRKAVLLLERLEREWQKTDPLFISLEDIVFVRQIAQILADSKETPLECVKAASEFLSILSGLSDGLDYSGFLQAENRFRHRLIVISGQSVADWDFIAVPRPSSSHTIKRAGMRVFLEDLRSPFNIGSIFRTAEALGFEEIILSPECADPMHPRAIRSSMGTIERMQWRRAELSELDCAKGVFALEVGGIPLDKFSFPFPGLMVVGSEELGVSNKALQYCSAGCVEIPLVGTKASLNVATAFGIAGYSWYYSRNLQA